MNIPVKKVEVNRKMISVIPDYFVEEYLDLKKGDIAIKMSRPKYKEFEDYLKIKEFGKNFKSKSPEKEYIGLTLCGLNSYFAGFRNYNKTEERCAKMKDIRKALKPYNPFNNWTLNIYDVIKDDNFEIDYIVDLLNNVTEITREEVLSMIDKNRIKTDMCMVSMDGKAVAARIMYVSKDTLKNVFIQLINEERIGKEELMYVIRKIVSIQSAVEDCA